MPLSAAPRGQTLKQNMARRVLVNQILRNSGVKALLAETVGLGAAEGRSEELESRVLQSLSDMLVLMEGVSENAAI